MAAVQQLQASWGADADILTGGEQGQGWDGSKAQALGSDVHVYQSLLF